jgi:hypothetical protein
MDLPIIKSIKTEIIKDINGKDIEVKNVDSSVLYGYSWIGQSYVYKTGVCELIPKYILRELGEKSIFKSITYNGYILAYTLHDYYMSGSRVYSNNIKKQIELLKSDLYCEIKGFKKYDIT